MMSRTLRLLSSAIPLSRDVDGPGNRRLNLRAEFGCDFRVETEPCLPRRAHLVQQHPQSIHRGIAATACRCQQWSLYWHIDDVADERGRWKLVENDIERRLADHALARRVDQHCGAVQG